jgi:hypothetical protein
MWVIITAAYSGYFFGELKAAVVGNTDSSLGPADVQ